MRTGEASLYEIEFCVRVLRPSFCVRDIFPLRGFFHSAIFFRSRNIFARDIFCGVKYLASGFSKKMKSSSESSTPLKSSSAVGSSIACSGLPKMARNLEF